MKIFLDTNILIDFLSDRGAFTKYATTLFQIAGKKKISLYTSSHAIATTYYILKKYTDDKSLRRKLLDLIDLLEVLDVTKSQVKKALISDRADFEDGIQLLNAESVSGMAYIVTRNLRDFKGTSIPAIAPEAMVAMIEGK
ncbi:MAG: type II toxin-antitoxin system VapC family toxin [Cecembia sp.]